MRGRIVRPPLRIVAFHSSSLDADLLVQEWDMLPESIVFDFQSDTGDGANDCPAAGVDQSELGQRSNLRYG